MRANKQLWIGRVEVRPTKGGAPILEGAIGAFVNTVTWASSIQDFMQNANILFRELDLRVAAVDDVETVAARKRRVGQLDDRIEEMIDRAKSNPDAIIYGTFHLFERDDA